MTKPERYQLPFEFGRMNNRPSVHYEIGFGSVEQRPEGSGRFVRQVREEIIVRAPYDAAKHLIDRIFTPIEAFDQEELYVLLLNTKYRITHEALVYRGTVNTIYIRPAELFKEAVRVNAPAILLSHVHPSGSLDESPEDVQVTQNAYLAGKLLGIEVLDHLIVSREGWVSLREKQLGFG